MSLLFIDSFDHYATADILAKYNANGGAIISAGSGRRGTAALQAQGAVTKGFAQTKNIIFGFAFSIHAANDLIFLNDSVGGGTQMSILVSSSGAILVYRNTGGGTLLASSAGGVITFDSYAYLEIKATIDNAAGSFDVHVNGTSVVSASGVNTAATGNPWVDSFQLRNNNAYFDDLYLCDTAGTVNNTFLGDSRVDAVLPNANGNSSQFTNSGGTSVNNYTYVNENPPDGDTSYVQSSTVGQKDTYGFTDISFTPASIFGVQINITAKKDDAGARSEIPVTRSSGTDYDGATVAVSTSYLDYTSIRETDPATSAAWTKTGFNAAEFGQKVA